MFILLNVILVHHNLLNLWKRQRLAVTIPTHIQNFIVWVIKLSSWIGIVAVTTQLPSTLLHLIKNLMWVMMNNNHMTIYN